MRLNKDFLLNQSIILELNKELIEVNNRINQIQNSRLYRILNYIRRILHTIMQVERELIAVRNSEVYRNSTKNFIIITLNSSKSNSNSFRRKFTSQSKYFRVRWGSLLRINSSKKQFQFLNLETSGDNFTSKLANLNEESDPIVVLVDHDYYPLIGSLRVIQDLIMDDDIDVVYSDITFINRDLNSSKTNIMPYDSEFLVDNVNVANGFLVLKNLAQFKTLLNHVQDSKHRCENVLIHTLIQNAYKLKLKVHKSENSIALSEIDKTLVFSNSCNIETYESTSKIKFPIYANKQVKTKEGCSVSVIIPTMGMWPPNDYHVGFEEVTLNNLEIIKAEANLTGISIQTKFIIGPEIKDSGKRFLNEYSKKFGFEVLEVDGPFNFSSRVNFGIKNSTSNDYFLLLNDDVLLENVGFLKYLLEHFSSSLVGAVGARLIYPNGVIQHAGMTVKKNLVDHYLRGYPLLSEHVGHSLVREVSGVTAALCVISKEVVDKVGYFSLDFPIEFGDVDYMLNIRKSNRKVIYDPRITAIHFESLSRGSSTNLEDLFRFSKKWNLPVEDPFYIDPN